MIKEINEYMPVPCLDTINCHENHTMGHVDYVSKFTLYCTREYNELKSKINVEKTYSRFPDECTHLTLKKIKHWWYNFQCQECGKKIKWLSSNEHFEINIK